MTPLGQLPFFIDFLKTSGLFDAFVADCPLRYVSPNAPKKRDVLGTAMLSMLAGHKRYAHIAALRCDAVLPELLGMKKVVSEDAIRRGLQGDRRDGRRDLAARPSAVLRGAAACRALDPRRRHDDQAALWPSGRSGPGLQSQEARASEPLLSTPTRWPRRVSFSTSTSVLATSIRRSTARRACGRCSIACRATCGRRCLRGDCGFGNEGIMREAEARGLPYLFKLRLTANVKRMIEKLARARMGLRGPGLSRRRKARFA